MAGFGFDWAVAFGGAVSFGGGDIGFTLRPFYSSTFFREVRCCSCRLYSIASCCTGTTLRR